MDNQYHAPAEILDGIYATQTVESETGAKHPLRDAISPSESAYLTALIEADQNVQKVLEVGCAFGISSLSMCKALQTRPNREHVIIDPLQSALFDSVGIHNLNLAGCDFANFIEEYSEFALPKLAKERPESFDLIFIDGYHTFDHTLIDLFYANILLRVGGYIVIDDCKFASVANAVSYFSKYPGYQFYSEHKANGLKYKAASLASIIIPPKIGAYILPHHIHDSIYKRCMFGTMVALKKVANDDRSWDWFEVS